MKNYHLTSALVTMAIATTLGNAQTTYRLDATTQPREVRSRHIHLGGSNPQGEQIAFNSSYMTIDGRPVIPVMGEFHYVRYPAEQWEEEIIKMKAGGVTILPTYIFWNLHEPVEGQFRWDGQYNLRRFVQLCQRHGMQVIVRVGPFCHGEIRNGGLPDWLLAKPLEVRSNDPEYLSLVGRLYREIGQQIQGLLYRDGGPIIGCQIENEMQHAASPWGIIYPGEPFDYTTASFSADETNIGVEVQKEQSAHAAMGEQHMRLLKQMAIDAGIVTPLYTATGWGNAAVAEGEFVPVTAAYTYPFWDAVPRPSSFLMFKDLTREADYAPTRYNPADYPSFCAEMGAGIQMIYSSRPIVTAQAAEALMVRTLGSGSNGIGYYMYHGGTTPLQPDGLGSMQDEPMGMPKVSYDFQAPLGEFGLEGSMYRNLRLLHTFLADFGSQLAPMQTVLPDSWQQMTPLNRDTLRYAARMLDDRGFVFMVNFQDHDTLRHDMTGLRLQLNLRGETLCIPSQGTFTLPKDESVILPFNLDMGGAKLKYATAQLLMRLDDEGVEHYIFFAPEGMATEYLFDPATVRGRSRFTPQPGLASTINVRTQSGTRIRITTLTRQQALCAAKVNGRLLIADATIVPTADGADLLSLGRHSLQYVLYPSQAGMQLQRAEVEPVQVQPEVTPAGQRHMSVRFDGENVPQVQEYYLRIDYTGDVAMAFVRGRLVQDEFYHGAPWTIGLRRYQEVLRTDPMTFYFRPLRPDAPFLRDLPQGCVPDFSHGPVVDVRQVEVVPQYRIPVNFVRKRKP